MRESAALRWVCTTAAAIAALALIAGCGGGGSATLNTDQLIAKGDAICQEGQKRFAEVGAAPPTSAKQAEDETSKLIASATDELSKLEQLQPPPELKQKLDAYLKAKREALGLLKARRAAAARGNEEAYAALVTRLARAQPARVQLAEAVGFKKCSQPTAGLPGGSG